MPSPRIEQPTEEDDTQKKYDNIQWSVTNDGFNPKRVISISRRENNRLPAFDKEQDTTV
jgi:hypothetical protein